MSIQHVRSKSHLWRSILFITVIIYHDLTCPAWVKFPCLSLLEAALLLLYFLLVIVNILQSLQDVKRKVVQKHLPPHHCLASPPFHQQCPQLLLIHQSFVRGSHPLCLLLLSPSIPLLCICLALFRYWEKDKQLLLPTLLGLLGMTSTSVCG